MTNSITQELQQQISVLNIAIAELARVTAEYAVASGNIVTAEYLVNYSILKAEEIFDVSKVKTDSE